MQLAQLESLSYWYPGSDTAALRDVDLSLDAGVTLVTGRSGGGKSSVLRVFNGLVPHFHGGTISGHATVLGMDVLRTPTRALARDVGFVFQDPELQSVYATVERDVAFGLENLGMPRVVMRQHVEEALHRTGMAALRDRAISTLSGGERQRCALAGVLASRPQLLVLDEPLSQLDDAGAAELISALSSLSELGTAVVIAEHRLDHVLSRADRTYAVDDGRVRRHAGMQMPQSAVAPRHSSVHARAHVWSLSGASVAVGNTHVLHDVSLHGGGDVVAVMGDNGSGKTTLLRTLAGLLTPLEGVVERPPGRVAYLPQNPTALLHRATVRDELAWTLRHTRSADAGAIDHTLMRFGISHLAQRYPRDLSTGERQRAALAAVLVGDPSFALLDEPTRGMDDAARASLVTAIGDLRADGCSVVLATHDRRLATAVADRVVHLHKGRIAALPQPQVVHA